MHQFKTTNIRGKQYVEVNQRILYFRTSPDFTGFSLETEIISLTGESVTMKAIVKDPHGRIIATGYAQEDRSASPINKTSYVENCETSAWGRCMANLGLGLDTAIASAEEVQNAINAQEQTKPEPKKPEPKKGPSISPEQKKNADDLSDRLGLNPSLEEVMAMEADRQMYQHLLKTYNEKGGREPLPNSQGLSHERIQAGINYLTAKIAEL
jgi:hypothetical protein